MTAKIECEVEVTCKVTVKVKVTMSDDNAKMKDIRNDARVRAECQITECIKRGAPRPNPSHRVELVGGVEVASVAGRITAEDEVEA